MKLTKKDIRKAIYEALNEAPAAPGSSALKMLNTALQRVKAQELMARLTTPADFQALLNYVITGATSIKHDRKRAILTTTLAALNKQSGEPAPQQPAAAEQPQQAQVHAPVAEHNFKRKGNK